MPQQKRTARAHMMFNVLGVLWMLIVFFPFTRMIEVLVPGDAADPANIPYHLSMFHTLFNISNTVLLIGFVGPMSRIVEKMVKDDGVKSSKAPYNLTLVPGSLPDAVDSNLITIRRDLATMAGEVSDMLMNVMNGANNPKEFAKSKDDLTFREQRVDDMQEQMMGYLTKCTRQPLGVDQSKTVAAFLRIANELESVADSTYGIGLLLVKLHKKSWTFHDQGDLELIDYTSQVLDFLRYNQDFLDRKLEDYDINLANSMEAGIDKMRNRLRKRSRKTIERDEDVDVKGELIFMDVVRHLEHIGDSSLNVSEAIEDMPLT